MDISIKYSRSAFKRGIAEEDIRHTLINVLYDNAIHGAKDKYLLIGKDRRGDLLEIMYNIINDAADEVICVFHAMKNRDEFAAFSGIGENHA